MPMVVAKAVSLNVKPVQSANLCFEVGGVLAESFIELGAKVSAFDFASLYREFRDAKTGKPGDPGRLIFDSDGIDARLKNANLAPPQPGAALAALRAEPVKAALNKAINMRANAVYAKYEKPADLITAIRSVASLGATLITRQAQNSFNLTTFLADAYAKDGRTGVVRNTGSVVDVGTSASTSSDSKGSTTTSATDSHDVTTTHESQEVTGTSQGKEHQSVVNTGYEYRVPAMEDQLRNDRLQFVLQGESLANGMQFHSVDRLEEVFKNELASIDSDVNQLQIAYLNTILLSPINGVVTGLYKNPGDSVRPGEPVMRVENDADVFLVARIVCRGPISIGSMIQVKTALFDSPGPQLTLVAPIVAVRGMYEDDQWEVIARRSNLDASGKTIFPLGYQFDYDNTEVNVFGANEI